MWLARISIRFSMCADQPFGGAFLWKYIFVAYPPILLWSCVLRPLALALALTLKVRQDDIYRQLILILILILRCRLCFILMFSKATSSYQPSADFESHSHFTLQAVFHLNGFQGHQLLYEAATDIRAEGKGILRPMSNFLSLWLAFLPCYLARSNLQQHLPTRIHYPKRKSYQNPHPSNPIPQFPKFHQLTPVKITPITPYHQHWQIKPLKPNSKQYSISQPRSTNHPRILHWERINIAIEIEYTKSEKTIIHHHSKPII